MIAEERLSPSDWRVLLASLIQFGKSPDGAVERDLSTAIEHAIEEARADERKKLVAMLREQKSELLGSEYEMASETNRQALRAINRLIDTMADLLERAP